MITTEKHCRRHVPTNCCNRLAELELHSCLIKSIGTWYDMRNENMTYILYGRVERKRTLCAWVREILWMCIFSRCMCWDTMRFRFETCWLEAKSMYSIYSGQSTIQLQWFIDTIGMFYQSQFIWCTCSERKFTSKIKIFKKDLPTTEISSMNQLAIPILFHNPGEKGIREFESIISPMFPKQLLSTGSICVKLKWKWTGTK